MYHINTISKMVKGDKVEYSLVQKHPKGETVIVLTYDDLSKTELSIGYFNGEEFIKEMAKNKPDQSGDAGNHAVDPTTSPSSSHP